MALVVCYILLIFLYALRDFGGCHSCIGNISADFAVRRRILQNPIYDGISYISKKYKYPHLLSFVKKGCEFCEDMESLVKRLNLEYNIHIECLDVAFHHNYWLMLKLDRQAKCGGLPFYYNLATHRHICGATTYQNLVAWALGKVCSPTLPSPLKSEEIQASYRRTGLYARLMSKLREILAKGEKKMIDRLNDV